MFAALSTDVYPELVERLTQHGLITAMRRLTSKRLQHDLRKPARLLHKGWNYVAVDQPGVATYILGDSNRVHQVLRFFRSEQRVELVSTDPYQGCSQTVEIDLATSEIRENRVAHDSVDGSTSYRLCLDGSLQSDSPPDAVTQAA